MKIIYLIPLLVIIILPGAVFASSWQPWIKWQSLGDNYLNVGLESHWGVNNDNQNGQFRCFTDTQLAGHYLQSIDGSISAKMLFNKKYPDPQFNEATIYIAVTNHTFTSVVDQANYLNSTCNDENGHPIQSEFGDFQTNVVYSDMISLVGRNSSESAIHFDNVNVYIPKNLVFYYDYGTGSPPPTSEQLTTHLTLRIK